MVTQTPWFQRSFNFDFPIGIFPTIFSRLEGTLFRLNAILQNADDEYSSYNKDGWSVKEQLGHLYDLEDFWWKRLNDFVENKAVLTVADLNNTKTKEAKHNEKNLEQLMQAFIIERQKMLETIYVFDAGMLSRLSVHPRLNQPMRMIDSLFFVAEHDDHHIAAISNLLRRPERMSND